MSSPRLTRHHLLIGAIWAGATLLTWALFMMSAQDTPATVWGQAQPTYATHLSFWDSGWYARIANSGYPSVLPTNASGAVEANQWAFMPLLPALAQLLSFTGASFMVRATAVSLAASAASAFALDAWLTPRTSASTSAWGIALLWSSPCALIFQVPYAESLGILGVTLVLLGVSSGRLPLTLVAIVLTASARPLAAPLAACLTLMLLWTLLRRMGERVATGVAAQDSATASAGSVSDAPLSPATSLITRLSRLADMILPGEPVMDRTGLRRLSIATATAIAAMGMWPLMAWLKTGRADAYVATETAWRGSEFTPVVSWLERSSWWVGHGMGWVWALAALALLALSVTSRHLRALGLAPWAWYTAYVTYIVTVFDPTTSVLRILLPLTPLAWVLATALPSRRARLALLIAGVLGQTLWIAWVWNGTFSLMWIP